MKQCRLCQSSDMEALPFSIPEGAGVWMTCRACGSASSVQKYEDVKWMYADRPYYDSQFQNTPISHLRADCKPNTDWFNEHARIKDGYTFLDIGFWHGAALDNMRNTGWVTHGYDVTAAPNVNHPQTIHPVFHRWHWPEPFSAVMAREVFEHVEGPENFLHECHGVTKPGELFQIQTPKPIDHYNGIPYQLAHLFLASPNQMRKLLDEAMFDVIDTKDWSLGQAYMCRARGG